MSIKIRAILVVVVGTVLGLTVSLGSIVLQEQRESRDIVATIAVEDLRLLAEAMERVRREYVDQVDDRQLIESAIRGMISELDTHSQYLDADGYEEIRISTTGNYSGVGLDVSLEDGKLRVVTPLDGTPAFEAGILPGDVVVSVDDVPVDERNLEDTVSRMRGEAGTQVMLDVVRGGTEEPLSFALTRAEIRVRTVSGHHLGDGYVYLRVSGFSDTTAADLASTMAAVRREADGPLAGGVLDLRNNPGGVLDAAVAVADAFLDEGLIVRGSGRAHEARFEKHAEAGDLLDGVPLIVLVNAGSASASEIVAGALKDHRRARVVGQRTYGKGSVQTVMPLGEGSAIKLTTARYFTPSGRAINGRGIEPDVVVGNAEFGRYRVAGGAPSPAEDEQLGEALRLMGYGPIELSKAAP